MEKEMTLEEVRKKFEADRFAVENGAVIEEFGEKTAICSLQITPFHINAMGAVMGAVYFMLADFTFAVASNHKNSGWVTLHSDISFLTAAKGSKLIAKAVCVREGKTTSLYRIDITDELGTFTAAATITGYRVG